MMDMSLDATMLDPTIYNNINIDTYANEISMEMGSIQPTVFSPVQSISQSQSQALDSSRTNSADTHPDNINSHNGIGAGPLPAGFGAHIPLQPGSTLTEFTKRRNWSQRVLEELRDLLYILTSDGRILYISSSCKPLTGHDASDLTTKFIFDYIHPDDSALFVREFNESIATGNSLRFFYRFRCASNTYTIFECHGHPHLTNDVSHMEVSGGPVNAAGFCRGFFMMARPYPTTNSSLLDSFLEHKIENVRLQARIAALKREEAEEAEQHAKHFHKKPGGNSAFSRTESSGIGGGLSPSPTSRGDSTEFHGSMLPPAKPTISNMALTREALDEANAFARPDSITDKMARYEGSSHVDSIEMLTGLRYREGERAHGISTGGTSPALIRGDAGIDIPADKTDPRFPGSSYQDKKVKKVKSADEFVCTDCGTLDSPEWRRGPNGPKTLCNACGLRWAKKEKKKGGGGGPAGMEDNGGGSGSNTVTTNGNGNSNGGVSLVRSAMEQS